MSTYRLDRLVAPRSIALVGASPRERSLGRIVLGNLRAAGFAGSLHLVNPRHDEIDGIRAVKDLGALPLVPDIAVVTAPAAAVPDIVAEAGALGMAGAVVISAGLGQGPGSLAEAARRRAREHGIRLLGPNGLGIIVPRAKLNASFAAHMPSAGDLTVISQSGAITAGLAEWAARRNVGFAALVSIGDAVDVDFGDLLDFFAIDHGTRAILLYVESISDARKFMSAARIAARTKPVIVLNPAGTRRARARPPRIRERWPVSMPSMGRHSFAPACCGSWISTSCSLRPKRSAGCRGFWASALRSSPTAAGSACSRSIG